MIRIIVIAVVLVIVAVLLFALTRPDEFRVQRATSIKAPPEKIFALINDLHSWEARSPYEKKDPAMKRTPGGAPSGKGATYKWDGNNAVGKGRMEIMAKVPAARITIKLDFINPFEDHNVAEFALEREGASTMYGPAPFLSRLMGVFLDLDRMIGKDFEAGLANLKRLAEK